MYSNTCNPARADLETALALTLASLPALPPAYRRSGKSKYVHYCVLTISTRSSNKKKEKSEQRLL